MWQCAVRRWKIFCDVTRKKRREQGSLRFTLKIPFTRFVAMITQFLRKIGSGQSQRQKCICSDGGLFADKRSSSMLVICVRNGMVDYDFFHVLYNQLIVAGQNNFLEELTIIFQTMIRIIRTETGFY